MGKQFQVTIDAAAPRVLGEFWCAVLGYIEQPPPEGFASWDEALDAFGIDRLHQVRLADNMGDIEGDMRPGTGNVDFASLFDRLYEMGYERHFNLGFGSKEKEFESREELVEKYGKD